MNKYMSIISVAALCMGFAACDEVEESLSKPQTNPQETIFNADNLVVTPNAELINLQSDYEAGTPAKVAAFTVNDLPSASNIQLKMQIAKDAAFTNAAAVEITIDSLDNVYANPEQFNKAYYLNVTKNPVPGTACVRFAAYAVNGSEVVRIGGPNTYFGVGELNIVPLTPDIVIDDEYYLCGTVGEATKMTHSANNVYDDPVFSIIVDVTADEAKTGYEWYIQGKDGKYYAPEVEPEGNAGALVASDAVPAETGVIDQAGPHKIEINMHDLTYKVSIAIDQLYTPGNSNGWNQASSQKLLTNDYVTYRGFAHLNGEFKFSSQPNWEGVNYGSTGVEGELSNDGGAQNLKVDQDALYWVEVNLVEMTYKITPVETLGLIGDFNEWKAQDNLTPSADFMIWTGKVTMQKDNAWKFRANDDWGINLGGDLNALVYDGANIVCDASGTYEITLDLSNAPYFCSVVAE